jgi:hypothetical protein
MSATFAAAFFIVALGGFQAGPPIQDPAPAVPPPRKLEVTFDTQGRVTIVAQQVTVSEILAEWGRKGGTKIQGAERLTGGVLVTPMLFDNRPELEVIEALTRQAAGVSIAPRRVGATGASRFESIYIVATSTATASSPYPSAPTYGGNAPPVRGFPDDEVPPVTAPGARDPQQQPQQQGQPPPGARPGPTSGSPVIVPVVPVSTPTTPPAGGRGGGGGTTTTTTGRGGGGGGR